MSATDRIPGFWLRNHRRISGAIAALVLLGAIALLVLPYGAQVSRNAEKTAGNFPAFLEQEHGIQVEGFANEPIVGAVTIRAAGLTEEETRIVREWVGSWDHATQPIYLIVDGEPVPGE